MLYLYIFGLIILILASIFDIKTREIPDVLNYSFFASIFLIKTIFSFSLGFNFLFEGLLGMLALGLISLIFFFTGIWGGGDMKLMFGLGFLLGMKLTLFNNILIFLACVIITGAVYGLLYLKISYFLHFKACQKEFKKRLNLKILFSLIILTIISVILIFMANNPFYITTFITIMILPLLYLLYIISKTVETIVFRKAVLIEKLSEGDWLIKDIKIKNINIKSRKIGLTKSDIQKLIQLKKQNLINKVEIKTGMPFAPVFLFAFVFFLVIKCAGILPI